MLQTLNPDIRATYWSSLWCGTSPPAAPSPRAFFSAAPPSSPSDAVRFRAYTETGLSNSTPNAAKHPATAHTPCSCLLSWVQPAPLPWPPAACTEELLLCHPGHGHRGRGIHYSTWARRAACLWRWAVTHCSAASSLSRSPNSRSYCSHAAQTGSASSLRFWHARLNSDRIRGASFSCLHGHNVLVDQHQRPRQHHADVHTAAFQCTLATDPAPACLASSPLPPRRPAPHQCCRSTTAATRAHSYTERISAH